MRDSTRKTWLTAVVGVLCAFIVIAHTALASHKAGLAHAPDEACEVCLAAGKLAGPVSLPVAAAPLPAAGVVGSAPASPAIAAGVHAYDGRAPPISRCS